jgi:hypothetical protein
MPAELLANHLTHLDGLLGLAALTVALDAFLQHLILHCNLVPILVRNKTGKLFFAQGGRFACVG